MSFAAFSLADNCNIEGGGGGNGIEASASAADISLPALPPLIAGIVVLAFGSAIYGAVVFAETGASF